MSTPHPTTAPHGVAGVDERFDDRYRDEWVAPQPDGIDRVLEVSTMLSVFEADRLVRVAALRDDALASPGVFGVTPEIIERSLRWDLAMALGITEYAAGELMSLADAVVHRYPSALDSLSGGRVTIGHVRALATLLDTVEPHLRDGLADEAVPLAEAQPVGVFRRKLTQLVEKVRADTLAERHTAAVAGRRLSVEAEADGMASLWARMPAVEARAIYTRATAMAKVIKAQPGEERTLDQIRADVVADLLVDGVVASHPKKVRGIRAQVVVTVSAEALLTDDDTGVAASATGQAPPRRRVDPPVVEGVGPIPIRRARELCGGEAGWMRVLTHPETGMVLSVGRKKYSAPKSLRALVKWRSETCLGAGCNRPAALCQIDHSIAWEHGGITALENHAPLCQGHHTVRHHGNWAVRQVPDSGGVIEWTSPTGRRYLVQPERRVPTFRSERVPDDTPAPF